jgi:hypothetical protein
MLGWLKQSTAATVKFGPFVDSTDGLTAETALTISQADIRLSKNGGDIAQTNNATGATHDELGYYDVPLDATDTNTLGRLRIAVHETGALPVWGDFMVLPANVWDSLFGADKLEVDVTQITGSSAAVSSSAVDANVISVSGTAVSGGAVPATLVATGLDSISTTAPTGVASNYREMMVAVWRRFYKKATKSATTLTTYADDGTTPITQQTVSDSSGTQTQGTSS